MKHEPFTSLDWARGLAGAVVVLVLAPILLGLLAFMHRVGPVCSAAFWLTPPIALLNGYLAMRSRRSRREKRLRQERQRQGCCPDCGYNLTGNATGVCSECGQRI